MTSAVDISGDRIIRAVSEAVYWLRAQPARDMVGDDSVGWWLLIRCGTRPLESSIREMITRLGSLVRNDGYLYNHLYTVTVLVRTLRRVGIDPVPPSTLQKWSQMVLFDEEYRKNSAGDAITNAIWVMQMLSDSVGECDQLRKIREAVLRQVSRDDVVRHGMIEYCDRQTESDDSRPDGFWCPTYGQRALSGVAKRVLDWQMSYLLYPTIRRHAWTDGDVVVDSLLKRQQEGRWDSSTDEEVEATSLVGLALLEYWRARNNVMLAERGSEIIDSWIGMIVSECAGERKRLLSLWTDVGGAVIAKERGASLEKFMKEFITRDRALSVAQMRQRTKTGEIDLVVNVLKGCELERVVGVGLCIIECRNRREKVAAKDVRDFVGKIRAKRKLNCRVGVMVSVSGFTKDARTEVFRSNNQTDDAVVGLVTGEQITHALQSDETCGRLFMSAIDSATD